MFHIIGFFVASASYQIVVLIVRISICCKWAVLSQRSGGSRIGNAERLLVGKHIVKANLTHLDLCISRIVHVPFLLETEIWKIGVLLADICILHTEVFIINHSKDVKPSFAVVHVNFFTAKQFVIDTNHSQVVETKALAHGADSLDANNSLDRGIIFGSWCHYDFYILNLGAAQLCKLVFVTHLSTIDIDKRFTTADNFYISSIMKHTWNMSKHIGTCSHVRKIASFNGSHKSIVLHSN